MSPRIERITLIPDVEGNMQENQELIADVPDISGIYETSFGPLEVVFCKEREDHTQKVIFQGATVQTTEGSDRRVVRFPKSPKKTVTQEYGLNQRFIFSRQNGARRNR